MNVLAALITLAVGIGLFIGPFLMFGPFGGVVVLLLMAIAGGVLRR